jgi:FSR family fosmidomycin resistance protein-like MFS transporter
MRTDNPAIADASEEKTQFQWGNILTIVGGHFIHDTYTAFIAPLLPLIIEKLSISLAAAGGLTAMMQFPSVLNPLIGYLADRINLRYFVIFAPAATATLIGLMGFAPSYGALAVLLFLAGISSAAFHSPAPPMIATVSGKRVGMGMSMFMAGGELGRTLGPIIAVAAVAAWGLEGMNRLIVIGWASSLIMFWRFKNISAQKEQSEPSDLKAILPTLAVFFIPLSLIVLARGFVSVSVTTFLPTFLTDEGASLEQGGIMLAILEGGGVLGAMFSGTISDRIGRQSTMIAAFSLSTLFTLIFLNTSGWLVIPVLFLLGFFSLAPGPVLLALVQDHYPDHRAVANGFYLMLAFLIRSGVLLLVGWAGDTWGLRTAFYASAFLALLAIPGILVLTAKNNKPANNL